MSGALKNTRKTRLWKLAAADKKILKTINNRRSSAKLFLFICKRFSKSFKRERLDKILYTFHLKQIVIENDEIKRQQRDNNATNGQWFRGSRYAL